MVIRRVPHIRDETKRSLISLPMSAPAPTMDPDPNAEKYQQYIGIGGVIFGILSAAWAKMKCPSKREIEDIVDERLEHQALMKMLDERGGK